ncbi:Atu4866 domain-containing protein [Paenibacillus sp. TRM 82003]|uniref:Atu4866 domain-containing protein n=1 Tax=Kineococcus sp. TRM81007 TaxID=2925831 RepID=UPI001F58C12C|nr:Atu4866 domain-containing protein [Kineococcus sp. TRM81007]MCI2237014.1 Atu4866 domain-containing protein [Kineococcus sp. TRM81007]MCI3926590.1 Atu4866 domain-containing protein [Paenibacillus sp. TRM 82003]
MSTDPTPDAPNRSATAPDRLVLLRGASVVTMDPAPGAVAAGHASMPPPRADTFVVTGVHVRTRPGTVAPGELHVVGKRLGGGPADPRVEVIGADGAHAVPLLVDSAVAQLPPARRGGYDLVPGNPATFAVVRRPVTEAQVRTVLVVDPRDLLAVWVAGHLEAWDGEPTRTAGEDVADPAVRAAWVGTWEDPHHGLLQHLRPDGRYSETRGGRADAYTGRYWLHEDRITYLDDSGFWAFGQLLDGVLHHAGFVMTRR